MPPAQTTNESDSFPLRGFLHDCTRWAAVGAYIRKRLSVSPPIRGGVERVYYSARSASIGSIREARRAGR